MYLTWFMPFGCSHVAKAFKIDWKDADKALTKLYPGEAAEDDDDPVDSGSFFNFFEKAADPADVRVWSGCSR